MGCVSKMKALALIASVALLAIFLGLAPQRATAQDLDEASRLNQRALELYEKGRLGLQVPRRELQHQHSPFSDFMHHHPAKTSNTEYRRVGARRP